MTDAERIQRLEDRLDAATAICREWAETIEDALRNGGELNSGSALPRILRQLAQRLEIPGMQT